MTTQICFDLFISSYLQVGCTTACKGSSIPCTLHVDLCTSIRIVYEWNMFYVICVTDLKMARNK
jgi:hypothetical protein